VPPMAHSVEPLRERDGAAAWPASMPSPHQRSSGRSRRRRATGSPRSPPCGATGIEGKLDIIITLLHTMCPPEAWPAQPVQGPFLTWVAIAMAPAADAEPALTTDATPPLGSNAAPEEFYIGDVGGSQLSKDLDHTEQALRPSPVKSQRVLVQHPSDAPACAPTDEVAEALPIGIGSSRMLAQHPSDPSTCAPGAEEEAEETLSIPDTEPWEPEEAVVAQAGLATVGTSPSADRKDYIEKEETVAATIADGAPAEGAAEQLSTGDLEEGPHEAIHFEDEELPAWPPDSWPARATFLVQHAQDAEEGVVIRTLELTLKHGHQVAHVRQLIHRATECPHNSISIHAIGDDLAVGAALENKVKMGCIATNLYFVARLQQASAETLSTSPIGRP
jgi:hypothetical protein